ncbi:hypothetical protein IMSAG025_02480 [Muribaculaceae bacterium]|nr:hypothetical protein IMSAG025_02480 [Muribaculaceae bacterium]
MYLLVKMSHGLTGNSSKCSISLEKQKMFISRKALTIESTIATANSASRQNKVPNSSSESPS